MTGYCLKFLIALARAWVGKGKGELLCFFSSVIVFRLLFHRQQKDHKVCRADRNDLSFCLLRKWGGLNTVLLWKCPESSSGKKQLSWKLLLKERKKNSSLLTFQLPLQPCQGALSRRDSLPRGREWMEEGCSSAPSRGTGARLPFAAAQKNTTGEELPTHLVPGGKAPDACAIGFTYVGKYCQITPTDQLPLRVLELQKRKVHIALPSVRRGASEVLGRSAVPCPTAATLVQLSGKKSISQCAVTSVNTQQTQQMFLEGMVAMNLLDMASGPV